MSLTEILVILLFKDKVPEVISKITYHFFSLFKDDMSTQSEKGHLSIVDEAMLVRSKRRKDNDDIADGEMFWSRSFSIYI